MNHLLYMDDYMLFGTDDLQLHLLLAIARQFTDDVSLKSGLDKCTIGMFIKPKIQW